VEILCTTEVVAESAATQARLLVARRRGVPIARVRTVAVSSAQGTWAEPCGRGPWSRVTFPESDTGYEVVLALGKRLLYAHVGSHVIVCGRFPAGERAPARTNLLAARGRTSYATDIAVAADRQSARMFALTPDGRLAALEPGGTRGLSALNGWVAPNLAQGLSAHALGDARLALETGTHVKLLNVRTGQVRVLDERPCWVTTAPGLALTHAASQATACTGVRAYGPDGTLRFTALPGLPVLSVAIVGRYAYAWPAPDDAGLAEIYVIELTTGRVVNRVRPSRPLSILRQ
jgi:hypothetical protein